MMLDDTKNAAERASGPRLFDAYNTPKAEAENDRCITLPKGATVQVQQLYGRYNCVAIKERPAKSCFWAIGLASKRNWSNITTPGKDLEWIY